MLWQGLKFWYDYFGLRLGKPSPSQKWRYSIQAHLASNLLKPPVCQTWSRLHRPISSDTIRLLDKTKWAAMWQNVPPDMCAMQRTNSACAFVQSIHSESSLSAWKKLHPWLSNMRPVEILISLCNRTGWSESSLGVHVRMYDFLHCRSNGLSQT